LLPIKQAIFFKQCRGLRKSHVQVVLKKFQNERWLGVWAIGAVVVESLELLFHQLFLALTLVYHLWGWIRIVFLSRV
jgi:hypothetical protein